MFLTDLPEDIILLILPLLTSPKDFLSFCSINKASTIYRLEPAYWRTQTTSTFRIPVNPLLKADGTRWYWLYKKLRTQTVAFAWGQDAEGCLGLEGHPPVNIQPPPVEIDQHANALPVRGVHLNRRSHPRIPRPATKHPYPGEMYIPKEVGIIADLQCGGWSTTILSSSGDLWSVGVMDAAENIRRGQPAQVFTKLQYGNFPDEGYPSTTEIEPITQFSAGRRHVLALDEVGNIWFWDQIYKSARQVEFTLSALIGTEKATRVVGGWSTSSAFIPDKGIVYWNPHDRNMPPPNLHTERIIPGTGFRRDSHDHTGNDDERKEAESFGEVLAHVVLEAFIVFITSTSKVFAFRLGHSDDTNFTNPFEITSLSSPSPSPSRILNIQGSFRNIALFSSTGQVTIADHAYLENWFQILNGIGGLHHAGNGHLFDPPDPVPSLQNSSVISVAFGDYHYHALHASGSITTYGKEPDSCGCLGLGPSAYDSAIGRLRGIVPPPRGIWRGESRLSSQASNGPMGRTIWFEQDKMQWLEDLGEIAKAREWVTAGQQNTALNEEQWTALSDWVEQEGRSWGGNLAKGSDGLGPYFAVGISAAGWHSGALVLVDHDLAEQMEKTWMKDDAISTREQTINTDDIISDGVEHHLAAQTVRMGLEEDPDGTGKSISRNPTTANSTLENRYRRQREGLPTLNFSPSGTVTRTRV